MTRDKHRFCNITFPTLLILCIAQVPAFAAEQPRAASPLDDLRQTIADNQQLDEAARAAILQLVDARRIEDPSSPEILTEALRKLNADFAAAVDAFDNEQYEGAISKLAVLDKTDDPFLAAESAYLLARCYVAQEKHEAALPLLTRVTGEDRKHTLHAGEAIFLRAVCESHLLKRSEAIASFAEFLRNNPDASERQRVNAWRQMQLLSFVTDGTLFDVHQKMEYSRRRLSLVETDKPTRDVQDNVVAILDKLIKDAEGREASAAGEGTGQAAGQGKPQKSGGSEEGPGGGGNDLTPYKTTRKVQQGTTRSPWDHLRDKKRDARALAAIKEKYPARYRELVEQYYRSLQEDRDR